MERIARLYLRSLFVTMPAGAIAGGAYGIHSTLQRYAHEPYWHRSSSEERCKDAVVTGLLNAGTGIIAGLVYPLVLPTIGAAVLYDRQLFDNNKPITPP